MTRNASSPPTCAALCLLVAFAVLEAGPAATAANEKPKVMLLGFDGADAGLTKRWMDEGALPNLKRLAEQGTFRPLETANPAQSPVSWAVLETASNTGKTNISDFVRRKYDENGFPIAGLAGVEKRFVDAGEVKDYVRLSSSEKALMWAASGDHGKLVLAGLALVTLIAFYFILRVVLRLPKLIAFLGGVAVGAVATVLGHNALGEVPSRFPVPVPEMKGPRFWDVLGAAGVRVTGLQVPAAFPADAHPNAQILAGLFTPDIAGGPGAWYLFTNDEYAINNDGTDTGGTILKLYEEKDGSYRSTLRGPDNFFLTDPFQQRIEAIAKILNEPGLSPERRAELEAKKKAEVAGRGDLRATGKDRARVDVVIKPDFKARTAQITIGEETQTIAEGKWSADYYRVKFMLSKLLGVDAIPRAYLQQCHLDRDDNKKLEIFIPAISISPEVQPPVLPISSPRSFAADIAKDIGLYDTLGWACYTNALKDERISEQPFLDGLEFVFGWRGEQLDRALDKKDWDVLFHLESATDRAGHMLYRFIDPDHPQYATKRGDGFLRDLEVKAYGRTFKLGDGIKETYREMDRIVGGVMKRIDAGEFGPDCTLMVVSDHGFQPFRWGVNLNVWLERMGYLVRNGTDPGKVSVGGLAEGGGAMPYVDWTQTRAYSLGLGKIFINLKDREHRGIVEPADFDALRAEIIAKLEAFTDPRPGFEGKKVVRRAYDGHKIYHGDYVDDAGDIVLGFESGYRVSWQTTGGGFEEKTLPMFGIGPNDEPWTGDHCGVDPSLVRGIFFSNKKLDDSVSPGLMNIAPTILKRYGVALPPEWDGTPLDLK